MISNIHWNLIMYERMLTIDIISLSSYKLMESAVMLPDLKKNEDNAQGHMVQMIKGALTKKSPY